MIRNSAGHCAALRMNLELVEFQSRKTAVPPARITHIGVGYSRMQVPNLDVALPQVLAAGATLVSKPGIMTMRNGTCEVKSEAEKLRDVVTDERRQGCTGLRQVADHLNGLGIPTARGGQWAGASVPRLRYQLGK